MLGAASSAHQSELSIHQPSRPNTRVNHYQAYFKGAANRPHTCLATSPGLCWTLKPHAECSRPAHTCSKKTKQRPLSFRVQLRAHTGSEREVWLAGTGKLENSQTPTTHRSHGTPACGCKSSFRVLHTSAHLGRSPTYSTVRPEVGFAGSTFINFQKAGGMQTSLPTPTDRSLPKLFGCSTGAHTGTACCTVQLPDTKDLRLRVQPTGAHLRLLLKLFNKYQGQRTT